MFKKILSTVQKSKSQSTTSEPQVQTEPPIFEQQAIKAYEFHKPAYSYTDYHVNGTPEIYYIKEHISEEQEIYICEEIQSQVDRWNVLKYSQRRVQKYGGNVEVGGLQNFESLPSFLQELAKLVYCEKEINHALINEYQKGIGIYAHKDGPLYFPCVNIISLNSHCVFNIGSERLLIEPRSLLIFKEQAYNDLLHGIEFLDSDCISVLVNDNQIIETDVINFQLTNLYTELQNQSDQLKFLSNRGYEVSQLDATHTFNYIIRIPRKWRTSITLRHVPLAN